MAGVTKMESFLAAWDRANPQWSALRVQTFAEAEAQGGDGVCAFANCLAATSLDLAEAFVSGANAAEGRSEITLDEIETILGLMIEQGVRTVGEIKLP